MATTTIASMIVPEIYTAYTRELISQNSYLWNSGLVRNDPELDAFIAGGGLTKNMPFMAPVTQDAANVGNDDPTSLATAKALSAKRQTVIRSERNQVWESMDLAKIMAGADPIGIALDQMGLGRYWANVLQTQLINQLKGIELDNAANDSSDMIHTAGVTGTAANGPPATADLLTPTSVAAAEAKKSDASINLSILIVHPNVAASLKVQGLTLTGQGVPQANGIQLQNQTWGYSPYLGKVVIVDRNCPAVAEAGGSPLRTIYTSFLVGAGAVGYGEAPHPRPLEDFRVPAAGNGSGLTQLFSRKQYCIHPFGFRYLNATLTAPADTPTDANFALAANWDRVFQNESIPLVIVKTNG